MARGGFPGGMGGMNMNQMMKQAKKMQEQMAKMQEEMETKTYEATSGGGAVKVVIDGKRELKEETGAEAEKFIPLGRLYPSPGYCGEIIWMFAAAGLKYGKQHPDDDEFLSVEKIPLEKAVEMILSGEITDAKTQAAVLKLKLLKDNGKI